jgi:hypothetical protein
MGDMMDAKREELWRSTSNAHSNIQAATFDLIDIARRIEYLHPRMADELILLANGIEFDRKTIQGNDAELISMDLADSQRFMGDTLMALLDAASKDAQSK